VNKVLGSDDDLSDIKAYQQRERRLSKTIECHEETIKDNRLRLAEKDAALAAKDAALATNQALQVERDAMHKRTSLLMQSKIERLTQERDEARSRSASAHSRSRKAAPEGTDKVGRN